MREHLYRGKRKDNGGWVYGSYIYAEAARNEYGVEERNVHAIIPKLFYQEMPVDDIIVIPETVGQYTGLKDKNGVKIFEGDIVLRRNTESSGIENKRKFLVVLEKGCFSIREVDSFYRNTVHNGISPNAYSLHEDYETLQKLTSEYPIVNGSFEVIGNIHDNPELLQPN